MGEYTQKELFEFLAAFEPTHPPGRHYEYANLGFGLLGIALANRSGVTYEELLIKRICAPLGMNHTRITPTGEMSRHLVGCNTFMGFSRRERRGAVFLENFLWQPLDAGTIALGFKLIKPDFQCPEFDVLYPH